LAPDRVTDAPAAAEAGLTEMSRGVRVHALILQAWYVYALESVAGGTMGWPTAVKVIEATPAAAAAGVRKVRVVVVPDTRTPSAEPPGIETPVNTTLVAWSVPPAGAGKGPKPHPFTVSRCPPAREPLAPDTAVSSPYTTRGFV